MLSIFLAPSSQESFIPFRFVCKRLLVYGKTEETFTPINLESGLVSLNEARRGQMDITYNLLDEQENVLLGIVC